MPRLSLVLWLALAVGCDGVDSVDGGPRDAPAVDAPPPTGAHPLYPSLDLATLPGAGGAASGPYEVPELPRTTRVVPISGTGDGARIELEAACAAGATHVVVPEAVGRLGTVNLGGLDDCDVELADGVVIDLLVIGSLRGPMLAPVHRVRIRGGQIGGVFVAETSTDVVLDGVTIDNGVVPSAARTGMGIQVRAIDRFAVVRSLIRMVAVDAGGGNLDGAAYLGVGARNVIFADDDVVTAGNRNSWGFRVGGGENYLFVDLSVRVSFHKLVRMNDAPVDYVLVRAGTWMRERTLTAAGMELNDSWAQLGGSTTDHVYIEDPDIYLMSSERVAFGMAFAPEQSGRRWEARRIHWHALAASAVDDAYVQTLVDNCPAGASCDYGVGTHTYTYDPALALPPSPWRSGRGDPDARPIAP
jgi:hypothetical protein